MSHDAGLSIGFFCPGWPPGRFSNGIVTYVSILAEQLGQMGHRATILADSAPDSRPDPSVYDVSLIRDALSGRPWNRVAYALWHRIAPDPAHRHRYRRALVETVARAVDQRGIQLVEIEESFGWARYLQEALPIPVCVRLHGPWFQVAPQLGLPADARFRARVEREGRAIAGAAGVTAPARHILDKTRAYYGVPLPEARVVPNPVEPAQESWSLGEADPSRLVFVGRFDRLKGGDLVIDAFAGILDEVPGARLWVIGPDRGFCDADGRTWRIEEYVRHRLPGALESKQVEYLGTQPLSALPRFRRRALATIVCSRYETFPYTVTEAMSLGCPVVAARVGGIPEIIRDSESGLLHEPGNPDDLARKVIALLRDPKAAARLGRQAIQDCERDYSPAKVADDALSFYRSVIIRHQEGKLGDRRPR
jgi:glycosyltransferase involved in cell wall biosynthesis